MRITSVARVLFAATFVAIGVIGLVGGNFAPVWQPVPKAIPAREALIYASAIVSLACGVGLLWMHTAATSARVLCLSLLLWLIAFRLPVIVHAPGVEGSWEGSAETAVIAAGAWALYAWLGSDWDRRWLGIAVGDRGMRLARVLFGLALIPLGLAHLVYLKLTAPLVPAWLPAHTAWAYFTGYAYIAAGVAVLSGVLGGLAAALCAVQMGLFTLLVWVPMLARGPRDASQWSESILSWTLTLAAVVVAESYRLGSGAPSARAPVRAGQEVVSRSDYDPTERR